MTFVWLGMAWVALIWIGVPLWAISGNLSTIAAQNEHYGIPPADDV